MPIEFRCNHCQKLLRTPDNSAGKTGKCPHCGELMNIPATVDGGLGERSLDRYGESPGQTGDSPEEEVESPPPVAGESPLADPAATDERALGDFQPSPAEAEPEFDAYYNWLGIPPRDQPPHYYLLLGIQAFEDNPDVIDSAADRQMSHVRSFQSGLHAADSQRLLNELSAARACLLDGEKKKPYDDDLRQELDRRQEPSPPAPDPPPIPPPKTPDQPDFAGAPAAPSEASPFAPYPAPAPPAQKSYAPPQSSNPYAYDGSADAYPMSGGYGDYRAHRGGMVLAFGIVSVVFSVIGLPCCCYVAPSLIGLGFGIPAILFSHFDLAAIRAGIVDPAGMGQTKAGFVLGIIGTALSGVELAGFMVYLLAIVASGLF